jgi:hypothetical protein
MVVGAKAIQMAVVTEMGDVAEAVGNLDQSYGYSGSRNCQRSCGLSAGSGFVDRPDQCEEPGIVQDGPNGLGVVVCGILPRGAN